MVASDMVRVVVFSQWYCFTHSILQYGQHGVAAEVLHVVATREIDGLLRCRWGRCWWCSCTFGRMVVTLYPCRCAHVWRTISDLQDPGLKRLATTLPQTVLLSQANCTSLKYMYTSQQWSRGPKHSRRWVSSLCKRCILLCILQIL